MNMKRLLTVLTTVLMMLGLCFPAYSQIEASSAEEAGAVIGQTEDPFVGADFDPQIAAENGYSIEMTEEGDYKITQGAAGILEAVLNLVKIFFFNLLVSFLIIQFFYYPKSRRMDYYFTFMMFSSAMCLLLFLMNNLSLEIGFTLGLFAIFGMIRYRTETVPVREMTYLFIIIAVYVINGIGADVPFLELVAANVLIILLIWLLESRGVDQSDLRAACRTGQHHRQTHQNQGFQCLSNQ